MYEMKKSIMEISEEEFVTPIIANLGVKMLKFVVNSTECFPLKRFLFQS